MLLTKSYLNSADLSVFLDPHDLRDDRLMVLWVLAVHSKHEGAEMGATAAEISDTLTLSLGIAMTRQKASSCLEAEVASRNVSQLRKTKNSGGAKRYRIMEAGLRLLTASGNACVFVDPATAFNGIRKVEEIIAGLRGTLRVCDPYVEGRSLDYFVGPLKSNNVSLLTANINKESLLRRDLAAFNSQHATKIEIRTMDPKKLHDRYIIHDDGLLILGTSLNGIGKKQSMIFEVGSNLRTSADAAFDEFWRAAKVFS